MPLINWITTREGTLERMSDIHNVMVEMTNTVKAAGYIPKEIKLATKPSIKRYSIELLSERRSLDDPKLFASMGSQKDI